MPEGDTIFRAARTLARALTGKTIARVASPLGEITRAALAGRRVDAVEAHGKNLVVRFDDGRALLTHMRMNGSWHLYRAGERWRKPEHFARIALEVDAANGDPALVAVCFLAPVVRLVRDADTYPRIEALGPDLLGDFDRAEALRRLRALGTMPIGEAIMHQEAVAGIGNIYKSETLFACGVDPFAPVAKLDEATLARILDEARRLLRKNVQRGGPMRTTAARHRHGSSFAVYDRSGERCFTCGETIRMQRQGALSRSTYYCPRCQAPDVRT